MKPAGQPDSAPAIATMIAILREENAALEAMDFATAGRLLAPKYAAAEALAAAWRSAEPERGVASGLRELGLLADQNRQALARAMRVQRRVLDLVARAARSPQPQARYGAGGRAIAGDISPQNLKTRV